MGRWRKPVLAGALALAACLCVVGWVNARETHLRRQDLELETRLVALQFTSQLRGSLEQVRISLEEIAAFFRNSEEVTETEFYGFASSTLQVTPICLRIPFLDSSLRVRWVYPAEPNRALVGFDPRTRPEGLEAVLRAKQSRQVAMSAPLELIDGFPGFFLAVPIFRQDEFVGEAVCAMKREDFFTANTLPEVLELYEGRVVDSGTSIFTSPASDWSDPAFQGVVDQFTLGGRTWQIRVRLREEIFLARLHSGQVAYWTVGCLLALAVGAAAAGFTHRASEMRMRLAAQKETLRETRQQLDGAMQQLLQAEKLTAVGELVAGVAHEINNPLASVLGYTQLLMREDLAEGVKRRLETVCLEAQRAGKIVQNLLTFARKHPPEKRYLGLNGIIEKTLELKAYHFRVNQVHVEADLAADLPKTMMDFHQMQQVLLNLLNNAEQAMAEMGRGGTVRISTRNLVDRIEARVSDSGPGISPENLQRVFEPFFTTKKEGKGTGLGLSICYGIIQGHGGTIRVESRRGGATFVIEIPITPERRTHGTAMAPVATAGVPARRLSVMVIDDEPSVQGFLMDLLSSKGHQVDTASDVPEAIRKIETNTYDLIITDMKMPHGTGKDIYEAAAGKSLELARRIVFMTGDGSSKETQQFIRSMGNQILFKPYQLEQIERVIANATKI